MKKKRPGAEFINNMRRPWRAEEWRPEPIEEYEEGGVTVKVYPPGHAAESWCGPTAKPKKQKRKKD